MEGYINENRWIDLSGLPHLGKTKRLIDWKNSVGYKAPFKYDEVVGEIKIVGYRVQGQKYLVKIAIDNYVPHPIEVRTGRLTGCHIHFLLKNRIINMAPELIQYLQNSKDAYLYPYQSNKKVKTVCPTCGNIADKCVANLYNVGFSCEICSDNISLPNKIMLNILTQLNIPFIREVGSKKFKWMKRYLYDFYINVNGKNILIEMDGGFHFREDTLGHGKHERDWIKNDLAVKHGFKVIRIDCDYMGQEPIEYIRHNILNSELINFLNLQQIDWNLCRQCAKTSMVARVGELWDEGLSVKQIAEKLNISKFTVGRYLKRAYDIGLCPSYSIEESQTRGHKLIRTENYEKNCNRQKNSKKLLPNHIMVLENDHPLHVFKNPMECERQSLDVFGRRYSNGNIYEVLNGKKDMYLGKTFKRISQEEYEQYKMIEDNIEVVLERSDSYVGRS